VCNVTETCHAQRGREPDREHTLSNTERPLSAILITVMVIAPGGPLSWACDAEVQTSFDIHSGCVDGASAKGGNEGQFAMKAKNSGCPSPAVHIGLLAHLIHGTVGKSRFRLCFQCVIRNQRVAFFATA
jgi:hypothetical protein